ncbi:hypothetical protein LTR66_015708, partial [Elasticomyces elasticus]
MENQGRHRLGAKRKSSPSVEDDRVAKRANTEVENATVSDLGAEDDIKQYMSRKRTAGERARDNLRQAQMVLKGMSLEK